MKYSANLPIQEQRRLDQLHLGMGSGNPYREGGLASVNPFAAAPTKDLYDSWTPEQKSEWDRYGEFGKLRPEGGGMVGTQVMGYHRRPKAGGGYEYHTTGGSADPLPRGGGWESSGQEWPGMMPPDRPSFPGLDWLIDNPLVQLPQPEVMPRGGLHDWGPKNIPGPVQEPPRVPQPEYPLPGPPNRPPPDFPQLIDMPRPPVMLPLPGQENPYPVGPIRPEVMPRPGKPRPEVTPRPGPQAFLGTLLPTGQQQSGLTYSDDEKIRPPSIQVSRKHGGSLTQTVLNVLRNLS